MKLMMKTAFAVACGAGLLLSAVGDQAAAAGVRRVTSTVSVQRVPAPVVRDHRTAKSGTVTVTPRGQGSRTTRRCNPYVWAGGPAVCRDHRS